MSDALSTPSPAALSGDTLARLPRLMVVMGVSACGKSTVANALAQSLAASFMDADDYHSAESIKKMSRGEPLTDEDRYPWLQLFGETLAMKQGRYVGACSALRRQYRELITASAKEPVLFIFLDGSKPLLQQRINTRRGHFMPGSLLDSQFATLERPDADELSCTINIDGTPQQIMQRINAALQAFE